MTDDTEAFELDFDGTTVLYGRNRVQELASILAQQNLDRSLLVCGSNVGSNERLMEPITTALEDSLVGVFDETTPAKRIETVYDGIALSQELNPDVVIGVGGGSSLDIARQIGVFEDDGRTLEDLRSAARAGDLKPPDSGEPTPVLTIPTTFAGAGTSSRGSIEVLSAEASPTDKPIRTAGSNPPVAVIFDPSLFETTPFSAISGSAMNGFNKGLETLYTPETNPVTDATAIRGLNFLSRSLPRLRDNPSVIDQAVIGMILVQFEHRTSIIHAFGHGLSRRYPVQQGIAHAIFVPHVLRYLFEEADVRQELIANSLGVPTKSHSGETLTTDTVDRVIAIRESLSLPSRLRELTAVPQADIPAIAQTIVESPLLESSPAGIDPAHDEIEDVVREAW